VDKHGPTHQTVHCVRYYHHRGPPQSTRDSSVPKQQQDSGWIGVVFASWTITIMPLFYFCGAALWYFRLLLKLSSWVGLTYMLKSSFSLSLETRFIVGFLFVMSIFLFNLTRLSRDGFMRRSSVIIFFKFLY
jgi:hypothetical protein